MLDVVQKALQRLPDELHIVERCMKALHPLTSDEYYNCFHSSGTTYVFFYNLSRPRGLCHPCLYYLGETKSLLKAKSFTCFTCFTCGCPDARPSYICHDNTTQEVKNNGMPFAHFTET